MRRLSGLLLALCLTFCVQNATSGELPIETARQALVNAGAYFRDHLGVKGTYVWRYSLDGLVRRGEGGAVAPSVGWVQPPGTPAVGAAFLRIFEVTGDASWVDAAHEVASALVATQLISGGWNNAIETDPEKKAREWCYRASGIGSKACQRLKDNKSRNKSLLDDNTTAGALNFLMWFDRTAGGSDPAVRETIDFALKRLMKIQYENGAFPIFFSQKAPDADAQAGSAGHASIPQIWPHTFQKPENGPYYIINDNLPRDTGRLFLNAYRLYRDPDYLKVATRIGDFLLATRLPPPQQAWAQQYDTSLQPVWGRRFEPPALVSLESAGSIDCLIELYGETGRKRYLDAASSAASWLSAVRRPDGSWSRYYELGTDRPLFIDNKDQITFEEKNLIDHYGMVEKDGVESVLRRLDRVGRGERIEPQPVWISDSDQLGPDELETEAARLVATQDAAGRWTDGGWIDGQTFVDGVFALSRFVSGRLIQAQ